MAIARFTLAVNRRYKNNGNDEADFISCVAFSRNAEFIEKYFTKGVKVYVVGRIQTGSYVNKDKVKVYTTNVVVEETSCLEAIKDADRGRQSGSQPGEGGEGLFPPVMGDGFINIPDDMDAEVPFS